MKHPSRAEDDDLLEMLARRAAGQSASTVAREMGVTKNAVMGKTLRVMKEDLAHEPEEIHERIRGAYW